MKVKRSMILLMVTVFILGVVGLCFSAEEIKGTVAKIDGDKLTIQDDVGKQVTISVQDKMTLRDLKVGDRISVKDGKVTKEKT